MTVDPLFDKHRLAVILNCGVAEALGMMTDGRIRSAIVAGKRQTRQSWVDAYIDSQADGGPQRLRAVTPRRRAS